jgi:hypothetical protein
MSITALDHYLGSHRVAPLRDDNIRAARAVVDRLSIDDPDAFEEYRDRFIQDFGLQGARLIFADLDALLTRVHRQDLSYHPVRITPPEQEVNKLVADYGSLHVYHGIPPELLGATREDAIYRLAGPTAIVLDQGKPTTRVVSVLMHGNEPSGFQAMLDFFRNPPKNLTTNVVFLVQNVLAAQAGHKPFEFRFHPSTQSDLNRQWLPLGTPEPELHPYVASTYAFLKTLPRIEGFLDLHNNSGDNPVYATLSYDDEAQPNLALSESLGAFLTDQYLTFKLSGGFDGGVRELAPAVAVECGRLDSPAADLAASRILKQFLAPQIGPAAWHAAPDKTRYEIEAEIALASRDYALHIEGMHELQAIRALDHGLFLLRPDIELRNFRKIVPGTSLGLWRGEGMPVAVKTLEKEPRDLAAHYFECKDGHVMFRNEAFLAMATTRLSNIRKSRTGFAYTTQQRTGRRFAKAAIR